MKNIILISIFILFSSCDPGLLNQYVVENKTKYDIKVESKLKFRKRSIQDVDSVKIVHLKPNSESLITTYGEIGTAHDKEINFLEGIDTIILERKNKKLTKNIFIRKNWNYRIVKNSLFSMDEVEYKLILTENNFE